MLPAETKRVDDSIKALGREAERLYLHDLDGCHCRLHFTPHHFNHACRTVSGCDGWHRVRVCVYVCVYKCVCCI